MALLDNGGQVGQCGWSSAESSTECSQRLAAFRKRKQVNVQWKLRGQEENKRKCKRRKHAVESLLKPGVNYAHFLCWIQP